MEETTGEGNSGADTEFDVPLMQTFERIYQDYKELVSEIDAVRSNHNEELRRREALEISCTGLKQENERLRRLNMETLANFSTRLDHRTKNQKLEEELVEVRRKSLEMEAEHEIILEKLEEERKKKIAELEEQISRLMHLQSESEARVLQLLRDLACQKSNATEIEAKCQREIQELRDWIVVEQEEKNELAKKLDDAESQLMLMRSKQAERQRESISIRQVEMLKQKLMKLRKENEALKRQLPNSGGSDNRPHLIL
ncbi:protein At-4/1-like [Wolffia australiana]